MHILKIYIITTLKKDISQMDEKIKILEKRIRNLKISFIYFSSNTYVILRHAWPCI